MPTKIEWADESWNPVTGCTKVSEGCRNCYAERMARRLAGRYGYPRAPYHFDVTLHADRLSQPLRWKKPRTIFVCSMGDLFHEGVGSDFLWEVLMVMKRAKQHTFLVLTKRAEAMSCRIGGLSLVQSLARDGKPPVLPNVWLGVSCENQEAADERIPILLQIPAAVHFVSLEPLLEEIDLTRWLSLDRWLLSPQSQWEPAPATLDGVFAGGETGHGARPMPLAALRSLRDQCQAAGVPFLFKSWGEWLDVSVLIEMGCDPYSSRFPEKGHYIRVGKKRAGRLLDGKEHNEMPDVTMPRRL